VEEEMEVAGLSDKYDFVLYIIFFGFGVSVPVNDDLLDTKGEPR